MKTARSLLASQRDASRVVQQAQKFAIKLPIVGRMSVPPPDQLAFYGALGLLAAVELIDWPVAVAIGVGQAVMAHHLAEQRQVEEPATVRVAAPRKAPPRKAAQRKAKAVKKTAPAKKAR